MEPTDSAPVRRFVHVGCGAKRQAQTTPGFNAPGWKELRFDIDPSVCPDVTGTMTDMSALETASCDAIFSSHNIEHLYPHEVPVALAEFRRVLKPDGFAVITCPDLKSVAKVIAEDKLTEPAYTSRAGPIAPIDILYGHRVALERGNLFMAHRCGFTLKVLTATLRAAGFATTIGRERGAPNFDLWVVGTVGKVAEAALRQLAAAHFPSVRVAAGRSGAGNAPSSDVVGVARVGGGSDGGGGESR